MSLIYKILDKAFRAEAEKSEWLAKDIARLEDELQAAKDDYAASRDRVKEIAEEMARHERGAA